MAAYTRDVMASADVINLPPVEMGWEPPPPVPAPPVTSKPSRRRHTREFASISRIEQSNSSWKTKRREEKFRF
ncbi:hypothetical protein E2C01_097440 [Portunus trituberculatus]|uniref:Uncharacterized protein n=1 Tax=Portunus trituberculatus TaxID=210409 RepID=A0A5B7JV66_PORTR|nr:hypothetical protein [Portunus trituberculatus]